MPAAAGPARAGAAPWGLASVVPALALAAATWLAYLLTLYPSVAGGDSGELVAAAWTGSSPHPPGYPLFALLARAFALALPVGEVAWRMNLFTATCAAAAAGFTSAAVARAARNPWAGVFAGGLFALAPTTWEYAIGAEVFALNHLFVAVLLLLAVRYLEDGRERYALAGAATFGLALANHHTMVFVGAPLLVMLVAREPRRWLAPLPLAKLVGCFAAGLIPYAWLPIASAAPSIATWGDQRTLEDFLTHLLRREYGTLRLGAAQYTADAGIATQLGMYQRFEWRELAYVGLPLAALGAWSGLRDRSTLALTAWLVSSWAAYVLVFHALANLPVGNPLFLGVQQRFWLMPGLLLAVLAGLGVASFARVVGASARATRATRALVPALAVTAVIVQFALNVRHADHRDAREFRDYGESILAALPANAIVLARGDLLVNTMEHAQLVEGFRRDVRIVDLERLTWPWMRRVLAARMPEVVIPGARLAPASAQVPGSFTLGQLVAANVRGARVFLVGNLTAEEGDVAATYARWPLGMASELVPADRDVDLAAWMHASDEALPRIAVPVPRRAPESWSRVVWLDVLGARHARAVKLLELGIARGDRALLDSAATALVSLTTEHPEAMPLAWKNLGLAYAHLAQGDPRYAPAMRSAWTRYLRVADTADPQLPMIQQFLSPAPPSSPR